MNQISIGPSNAKKHLMAIRDRSLDSRLSNGAFYGWKFQPRSFQYHNVVKPEKPVCSNHFNSLKPKKQKGRFEKKIHRGISMRKLEKKPQ